MKTTSPTPPVKTASPKPPVKTTSPAPTKSTAPSVKPSGAPRTGGGGTAGSDVEFLVPLAALAVLAPVGIALTRRRRVANE
ncbi:hypothetical protein ACNTMW_19755 [Planosporangium sp. 12N6]|uniref:hypothetical protein n=1 Tax=Planosporangium spinosum TaxID=3402278 RepID=UPI003CF07E48